ncbi:hypothetical protein EYF80_028192 [Liparis tanakae]|uniref:Uncharacterized protein n=1 Tax=Liparis tanakae TaxID=230148 RepID=A0A4Z2H7U8_9TELE|nr:hypothetical protein EYF80_028192 [Liparis tanakae]
MSTSQSAKVWASKSILSSVVPGYPPQPALLVSLHGGPAVVYVHVDVAKFPPAVLGQPSMSQRKRSHASQPIGGTLISPLSRAKVTAAESADTSSTAKCILERRDRGAPTQQSSAGGYVNQFNHFHIIT